MALTSFTRLHLAASGGGVGSDVSLSGNLHNLGSMAFGLGTSAVGSPGFGQYPGFNPTGSGSAPYLGPNPNSLASHAGPHDGSAVIGAGTAVAPMGGAAFQEQGTYHPFGTIGGIDAGLQSSGFNQRMPALLVLRL